MDTFPNQYPRYVLTILLQYFIQQWLSFDCQNIKLKTLYEHPTKVILSNKITNLNTSFHRLKRTVFQFLFFFTISLILVFFLNPMSISISLNIFWWIRQSVVWRGNFYTVSCNPCGSKHCAWPWTAYTINLRIV